MSSSACTTVILLCRSRRSANGLLKAAGMCWVMTVAGASAGICSRITRIASVPPVDAPMAIRRSVVRYLIAVGCVLAADAPGCRRATRARAAWRTRSQSSLA